MRSPRSLWWMDGAQRWRWRHWRLWRGAAFDDNQALEVCEYAALRLGPLTREVFLRHRLDDQDYPTIARELGISVLQVEKRLAHAISGYCQTLDLIARAKPKRASDHRTAGSHVIGNLR